MMTRIYILRLWKRDIAQREDTRAESKYATRAMIQRCWCKMDVLLILWGTTINQDIGREQEHSRIKHFQELCRYMSCLIQSLKAFLSNKDIAKEFHGTYVYDTMNKVISEPTN